MHEVGLMTQALDLAAALAHEQNAQTIHRLVLRVGAFSGVDADALRLAFEAVSAGTVAAGASLVIEGVAPRCWCTRCQAEFAPPGPLFSCPNCATIARRPLRSCPAPGWHPPRQ
jgi:hydrogenase nickel incorporation protein HypA/HybF